VVVTTQGEEELRSRSADGEWLCASAMSGKHGITSAAFVCHWRISLLVDGFFIDVTESVDESTDVSVRSWVVVTKGGTVPITCSCLPRACIVL
jgi:hypothetical protein